MAIFNSYVCLPEGIRSSLNTIMTITYGSRIKRLDYLYGALNILVILGFPLNTITLAPVLWHAFTI
jgi:phage baseplate assembly protein W